MTMLVATDLTKTFIGGDGGVLTVLDGVSLTVERGEMVAVVGASGAGKSTLLHLLGALDRPTGGHVSIGGEPLDGLDEESLATLRNRKVGFVFQFHHLLRDFSALENVMVPMQIAGRDAQEARARAEDLLGRVGLGPRMSHRPSEMSGGEQQRTAVARALALEPAIVLADEPSGNLDHANSELLHDLFARVSRELDIAMVIATHNRSLAARADRILVIEDGRLAEAAVGEAVP